MNLFDKIDDVLEQENNILPKREKEDDDELDLAFDEEMFNKMANFIVNLDPDKLSDDQVDVVLDILDELDDDELEDVQELRKPKLAKRTPATKNQYSKKWYRKNRTHVKRRKKRFKRSAEGRKRANKREILARQGKTATGRKKLRYHVRKRSDRKDREKTLNTIDRR
jgi:hypothetical protein